MGKMEKIVASVLKGLFTAFVVSLFLSFLIALLLPPQISEPVSKDEETLSYFVWIVMWLVSNSVGTIKAVRSYKKSKDDFGMKL